jgi:hypothetical protein
MCVLNLNLLFLKNARGATHESQRKGSENVVQTSVHLRLSSVAPKPEKREGVPESDFLAGFGGVPESDFLEARK